VPPTTILGPRAPRRRLVGDRSISPSSVGVRTGDEPRRDRARVVFARAIERGEIPPDTEVEVALDLLYGPFYHRLLHGHAPLTDRFASAVVDHVAAAVSAARSTA
jgi:tetracycline repressor-like protein